MISYNSLLHGLSKHLDSWPLALELLTELSTVHRPTAESYTQAIGACERGECWDGALALLDLIPGT